LHHEDGQNLVDDRQDPAVSTTPTIVTSGTRRWGIKVDEDFASWTPEKQSTFLEDLRVLLNVADELRFFKAKGGCVELQLDLTDEQAKALQRAFADGKLAKLKIVSINPIEVRLQLPELHRSTLASDDASRAFPGSLPSPHDASEPTLLFQSSEMNLAWQIQQLSPTGLDYRCHARILSSAISNSRTILECRLLSVLGFNEKLSHQLFPLVIRNFTIIYPENYPIHWDDSIVATLYPSDVNPILDPLMQRVRDSWVRTITINRPWILKPSDIIALYSRPPSAPPRIKTMNHPPML